MQRGDVVKVRAFPDKVVERVVWEEFATWVMLCRREVYEEAQGQGQEEPSAWMAFPKEDILPSDPEPQRSAA